MIKDLIGYILSIDKYLGEIIKNYGILVYPLLFLVIFAETGFVLTPFLPGDSLLFVVGTFTAAGFFNLYIILIILILATILGDTINYWAGNYFGEKVFAKHLNRKYLQRAEAFYKKNGAKTIVIARFIPIIRTFAPFVAGVGKMHYSKFLTYNIVGGILWVLTFILGGYFFGSIPLVKNNLTIVIIGIIIISFIPAIVEYFKERRV